MRCSLRPSGKAIQQLEEGEKIFDRFSWSEVLQERGDGGKVVVGRRKQGETARQREVILKIKAKASFATEEEQLNFRRMFERLLSLPPHSCIVRLQEVFEDDRFYCAVMPRAEGGALIDGLLKEFSSGVIPAPRMKVVMRDMLAAVGHIHANGILHRDIKADNLVVQGKLVKRVSLIDFDHAYLDWSAGSGPAVLDRWVGTPRFAAPETFLGQFSQASDLYSVGAVLYLLVTGKMPYHDRMFAPFIECAGQSAGVARRVHRGMSTTPIDFESAAWASQPLCRHLCEALLQSDPRKRPSSAEDAQSFPWFRSAS